MIKLELLYRSCIICIVSYVTFVYKPHAANWVIWVLKCQPITTVYQIWGFRNHMNQKVGLRNPQRSVAFCLVGSLWASEEVIGSLFEVLDANGDATGLHKPTIWDMQTAESPRFWMSIFGCSGIQTLEFYWFHDLQISLVRLSISFSSEWERAIASPSSLILGASLLLRLFGGHLGCEEANSTGRQPNRVWNQSRPENPWSRIWVKGFGDKFSKKTHPQGSRRIFIDLFPSLTKNLTCVFFSPGSG